MQFYATSFGLQMVQGTDLFASIESKYSTLTATFCITLCGLGEVGVTSLIYGTSRIMNHLTSLVV